MSSGSWKCVGVQGDKGSAVQPPAAPVRQPTPADWQAYEALKQRKPTSEEWAAYQALKARQPTSDDWQAYERLKKQYNVIDNLPVGGRP